MRLPALFLFFALGATGLMSQSVSLSGKVLEARTQRPISLATVRLEGTQDLGKTDKKGDFEITTLLQGLYILQVSAKDFAIKRIPISLEGKAINLGSIFLEKDITVEKTDNLITLTEADLSDDEDLSASSGLLQSTRDVFLNRAAFDFSQAFFRVRGYDSRNAKVLINGIPMNKLLDGRPQWNNWGGLNDVVRNQEFTYGLSPSEYGFGGILGLTNIDTRPSAMRPGTRLSSSASNRTYAGRLMATYNSGKQDDGPAYTVSASRRWANQGYIEGTLYDAYSIFGSLEYNLDSKNSFLLSTIMASNRRGRSSAITEEVFQLGGRQYNPYWGFQNGEIRNSRERKIREPILMLNHFLRSGNIKITTGVAYRFGIHERSRLGYYNAPNPDPSYYRYLPSFYVNSSIGANFLGAELAREGFLENGQLPWQNLYLANTGGPDRGKASYVLYDDVVQDKKITVNSVANIKLNDALKVDIGTAYENLNSENYAKIKDLLGADFHEDIDPFSDTRNNLNGNLELKENEFFNYNYNIESDALGLFGQAKYNAAKWDAFLAGEFSTTTYEREGLFLNERFEENSLGKGEKVTFSTLGAKAGFTYKIDGRHRFSGQAYLGSRPPVLQNVYVNPRENNRVVPAIQKEKITSADFNYFLRLPDLTGRVTGFYTRFQNITDINFFFVDSGVGSDFVQEVITDLDQLNMGIELGLEYQISAAVKLSAVGSVGKYVFASDPNVSINFDTADGREEPIAPEGNIDLGISNIKDLKLAQGPQKAFAFGLEYRNPKYWWVGMTANYLANNYANISTITRTPSFLRNPETGEPFPEATKENVERLLRQNRLDNFYLLNLVGGKSWLKKGKYISVFASINNVFDVVFRTGGYEQSRNGNYGQMVQDNLSGTPSFAPKYWYGYGRTYFLNLAFSF